MSSRKIARARWRGRWLRWRRWEYWPTWMVYAPIVPALAARSRRMGGLRTATCVNPVIPLGGLIGESKSEILREIGDHPAVARWKLVDEGPPLRRLDRVEEFASRLGIRWPLVLKPDRGERGAGVRIVHDRAQCERALEAITIPVLAQEFVPGEEYGVFWYRPPGGDRGRLLSITHKVPVKVRGDGIRTLAELICAEDRLLPTLDLHLQRFAGRGAEVLEDGRELVVTELGTHARGATFLDARHLDGARLATALDDLMARARLDFGRFDVRVPSEGDLVAGRRIRVLEFNGLSSEVAHVYDPGYALRAARRDLLEQWSLALSIGWHNRERGRHPASWGEVIRAIRSHQSDRRFRGVKPKSGR